MSFNDNNRLESLKVYRKSMALAEEVWKIVDQWDYFKKDTIGKQWVRSADSIAANISEGYGRFHYKEARHFYYYSRGSLFETGTWLEKARNRNLLDKEENELLREEINEIGKMLNAFINTTGRKSGSKGYNVNEPVEDYGIDGRETQHKPQ